MSDVIPLGEVPADLGRMPKKMLAWVIRPEREGDPEQSMKLEEVDVPEPGPNEALVLVMGAGVNFNGVWAARGKPVSVFKMHSEPMHIAGSDASGIVWKVGDQVKRWKAGDEVVIHCNQSCGQCPECNGLDPMACSEQKIWGYETSWGSFAQFTKVQAQQLLRKPKQLDWLRAASYGLTYFTAYRMLVHQAEVTAGDNVLVWGAAGGLGVFAVQICKMLGANPIAIVGGKDKVEMVKSLGASAWIDRNDYPDLMYKPPSASGRSPSAGPPPASTWSSTCATCGCGRSRSSARTSPTPTRPSAPTSSCTRGRSSRCSTRSSLSSRPPTRTR